MDKLEQLSSNKDAAWKEYQKLKIPADEAYKKYDAASKAHKEAELYEKIRRKVLRDLINSAESKKESV